MILRINSGQFPQTELNNISVMEITAGEETFLIITASRPALVFHPGSYPMGTGVPP
jgi:hypothetical protein